MSNKYSVFAMFLCAILAVACTKGPTYNSAYGQHVRYTPTYQENKVFWAGTISNNEEHYKESVPLLPDFVSTTASLQNGDYVQHGEPLTVVLSSAVLPTSQTVDTGKHDLAVIIDMVTAADGKTTSLLAWYQRGVKADQALNFSNLVVHYEPRWDSRLAPMFRIRLMDVATEKNEETEFLLSEAGKYGATIAQVAQIPIAQPTIDIAARAASLALGNKNNTLLLDYTVQFFSQEHIAQSAGAGLGALKRGKFIVIGRPQREDMGTGVAPESPARTFWKQDFYYNRLTEIVSIDQEGAKEVVSPFISLILVTAEAIVPVEVLERSAYLSNYLFSPEKPSDLERIATESEALFKSVNAYTKKAAFLLHRDIPTFIDLADFVANGKDISPSDSSDLLKDINKWVVDTNFATPSELSQWLTINIGNLKIENMKITVGE